MNKLSEPTAVSRLPIGSRFLDRLTGAEVELVDFEGDYCIVRSCCGLEADFYALDPERKRHLLLPAGITFYVNSDEPAVPLETSAVP